MQNVTTYSFAPTMKDILYERKEFLYPPYSRLIKLRFKHKNKERLDKIRDTLADAYGIALKLQTEPWRDDAGWETPLMRRKRLQQEDRRQAQMLLETDAAAQDILRLFDAQWLLDTLELAGQDEQ